MTDNEIKKDLQAAMEWFAEHGRNTNTAIIGICERALDLINRLQAENERLKKSNRNWRRKVQRLRETIDGFTEIGKLYSEIKAEAYKEFADKAIDRVEKAKQKYQRLCKEQGEEMEEHMHIHFNGIIGIIKNLLKELVGEGNE